MQYKEFQNIKLSRLGMGNMRLPVIGDDPNGEIDYDRAKAIIDRAMKAGINYYDTAYIYHAGKSEEFVGKALKEYPRESYYVADKFNLQAQPDYRIQFEEQLGRLQMEYIDFYLIHGIQEYFAEQVIESGCIAYFDSLKQQGKIRYLGFSFHSTPQVLQKMLTAYKWDFVQIQLNYYDWLFGDARELYEILEEAGIPVMVMEPVHGGLLAELNEKSAALLKAAEPEASLASWAMRWVMSLDMVQVVLSGMSNEEQVEDNVKIFSEAKALDEKEQELVEQACAMLRSDISVPCTGCHYCCPDCPKGLDIPVLLKAYNEAKLDAAWRLSSLLTIPKEKWPTECIGCGTCTGHCPQGFDIPQYMAEMKEMLKIFED